MVFKFKLKNRFPIVLVLDKENEEYFLLSENHKQYIKGKFNDHLERVHHFFRVASNEYELVLDTDDAQNNWESWSIFDIKKQEYLSIGGVI